MLVVPVIELMEDMEFASSDTTLAATLQRSNRTENKRLVVDRSAIVATGDRTANATSGTSTHESDAVVDTPSKIKHTVDGNLRVDLDVERIFLQDD